MKYWIGIFLWFILVQPIIAQTPPPSLTVHADQTLGKISPYVYGSNFGVYSAIPAGFIPEAQASGVKYLRWGGGFSDQRELTSSQIDTFIMTAKIINAEPAITVRLVGSTPEESAKDVYYANITKQYGVRYWSIGNEPSLFESLFDDSYDTERYNQEWRQHAEAMLAVDPNIILVGPDVHQYVGIPALNPKDKNGLDWLETFLRANGDLIGVVSVHRYPFPRSQTDPRITIEDLRQNTREWDENIIPNLKAVIEETTGKVLPIAIAEVNSSWANNIRGEATLDSHYNAIWYGDVLGRLIRQGVFIVAQWSFASRDTSFGMLGSSVRPIYYTFQMYQRFGQEAIMTHSDFDGIQIYGALQADGALTLMLINLEDTPMNAPLTINGFEASNTWNVWLFDPENNAVDLGEQPTQDTVTLPAQSMTLFIVYPQS